MSPTSRNITFSHNKMSKGFRSPFGIGFIAPNDPRLSSPRIIASRTQANILKKPPSIVYESPTKSLSGNNLASTTTTTQPTIPIPAPLSAVLLTPSPDISQQQERGITALWSPDTSEGSSKACQEQQQQKQQRQQEIERSCTNNATLSPSKTTFNSSTTASNSTSVTPSPLSVGMPTTNTLNQGSARSPQLDLMTTSNSLLVSNSDKRIGADDDDDIQSVIVINHKQPPQQNVNDIKNLVSPASSSKPNLSRSMSSPSSSQPKHNNIDDNINKCSINQQQQQQRPQSVSQPISSNNPTSPQEQTTNVAKAGGICSNQNGATTNQHSFLKMKSRPKKNDRTAVLPANVASDNKAGKQLKGSSTDTEEEKFSTPPSQPGQNVIITSRSPEKLHEERPPQSQLYSPQQAKPHSQTQQAQTYLQSQQKMQSSTQQPQPQSQQQLKQQDSSPDTGTPSLTSTSIMTTTSSPSLPSTPSTPSSKTSMKPPRASIYYTPGSKLSASSYPETPFSWDVYLKIKPAEAAPKEAFMQSIKPIENNFKLGMKIEAKDPRNKHSWCLASIVGIEGLRLKLRFEGTDNTNDFFELVDSEAIRSIGSRPDDILLPPTGFRGNLSTYPKFVEKTLSRPDCVIAPPELFHERPARPSKNLFFLGAKLEAVDRKNPQLICPATVGEVNGAEIKVVFDGWKGPFDYSCEYYSRDIFPINWCRDTNHFIMCPKGWDQLLSNKNAPIKPTTTNNPHRTILLPVSASLRPPTPPAKTQAGPKLKKAKPKKKQEVAQSAPKASPPPPSSPAVAINEGLPDDTDTTIEDNYEDIKDLGKVSCQRATSIDIWKKSKQQDAVSSSRKINQKDSPPIKKARRKGFWDSESDDESDTSTPTKESKHVNFDEDPISTQDNLQADSNRSNASTGSTYRHLFDSEIIKTLPANPTDWTVGNVLTLIKADETLAKYSNIFECHEIDGKAFILLTNDVMIKHMGIKIGPVLKIHDLIEQVKRLK